MIKTVHAGQPNIRCPLCGSSGLWIFFEILNVPASCNLLWSSKEEAVNCPKGDIKLAFCPSCTFITNIAIDPKKIQYGQFYDNTLFYSQHFQEFAKQLANKLVQRYDLHNKTIVEIGCGKVDFLSLFRELGNNKGTRLSPTYSQSRDKSQSATHLVEPLGGQHTKRNEKTQANFIFSYHELEHVNHPENLLKVLRRIFGHNPALPFFFAVPNALKAFKEGDFTDIIYEHVSYFTANSLFYLLSHCGFNVSEVEETEKELYDSIYITATAKRKSTSKCASESKPSQSDIKNHILTFSSKSKNTIERHKTAITKLLDQGKRVAIWGAGARGVTFLNIINDPRIEFAVDINPRKNGKYIPGTGQKIVAPEFLLNYRPDFIILANPAYEKEIERSMDSLGIVTRYILI